MAQALTVNLAVPQVVPYTEADFTGIDKRPVEGPVTVTAPGPRAPGTSGSGLSGDVIGDLRFHGGDDQAVYAYAREDLDDWAKELGRELPNGVFGENLTTSGLDVTGALIGERWLIGKDVLLEVTSCRIPCRTFATWLDERGWMKRFTQDARPGAYLRVLTPGDIQAGDPVEIAFRPDHEVTIGLLFRAMTTEARLLPEVLAAEDALNPSYAQRVHRRLQPS